MGFDEEKAVPHGAPQEIFEDQTPRPQRPLTAAEKLEATRIDINPRRSSSEGDSSAPEWQEVQEERGILARLRAFEALMDRKLGVESEAIVRKLPEERQPVSWAAKLSMFCLWASGTMNLSCFATGFLGWKFGLTLTQSILIIVFASLLGGAVSGFCATMGPQTGLRQISIGRFSMGWYPNKIVALLNTIQQIGWSSVGCITGGLALTAVSDGSISIAVGIVVIAVCSTTISVVGLRAILVYERYAWLVYLVIFLVIYGQTGRYANDAVMDESARITGATLSGTILSLFAIVYGSSASWATIASDYYAHYPVKENRTKIFIMTALGIALPTSFAMVAGAVVASTLNTRIDLAQVYGEQGLGFLVQEMLYPLGFAKLILVLLVLSGINMNIINTYSAAISCQQFARPCAQVPRFLWTLLCFGVIIALALAGRNDLLTYLENFLALLGYWCTSYFVIVFTEHYLFRRADFGNYDLDGWNDPARLPRGYAAFAAFSLGVIAWVMGMVQSW
jgi:NCS1 nucleoside transporter family